MPTITLNKNEFEQLVGKQLPLEELKNRISMLGTDLEDIKDNEIHVEIFPNRPDLLSEQGFARAFSSFIGVKTGLREYTAKESKNNHQKIIIDPSVKGIRPYTACAIVKGLNLDDEHLRQIIKIQEKLHVTYGRNRKKAAIGIYPLEKITFPVTYKADVPQKIKFKPLEAGREMTAAEILEEHKAGREYAHLMQGLPKYPFFIDAKGEILSMPPVINSENTGRVTEETKDVFVECSGFDFEVLSTCLNMIVTALADMGGEIYSLKLEYHDGNKEETKITPNLTPGKMKLDLFYVNKRLGLSLSEQEAVKLLGKMGYGFEQGQVLVPAYRADILHQVDLIEDIAIAYGYEHFQEEIPNVATIGKEDAFEKFADKVRELLVGLQLLEAKNFHLTTKEDLTVKMNLAAEPVSLKNALGDHNHLRNAVMPSLMKNLAENQHHEYPQNIFEMGRIFVPGSTETGVLETEHLSVMLCHDKTDFTEIRQVLETLFHALGLECGVKESEHSFFIPGRSGDIQIDGKKIGIIGELHPQVITNWQLLMPVVGFELDLGKLFELACKS